MTAAPAAVGFPGQGGDWRAAIRTLGAHPDHPLVGALARSLAVADNDWSALDQTDTRNSQPAVFVAGLVAAEAAGVTVDTVNAAIGHSLGEITACCFAGAMTPEAGLALVVRRAELGHRQHAERPGSMVAVMRLTVDQVEWVRRAALAEQPGVLDIAVVNSDTQIVLSGDAAVAERAIALAEDAGGVARPLPIGGAFHSPLMVGAVEPFAAEIADALRADPKVPVVLSTSAGAVARTSEGLPTALARSLVLPVIWPAALRALHATGVARAYDAGPGDALSRLARHEPLITLEPLPTPTG